MFLTVSTEREFHSQPLTFASSWGADCGVSTARLGAGKLFCFFAPLPNPYWVPSQQWKAMSTHLFCSCQHCSQSQCNAWSKGQIPCTLELWELPQSYAHALCETWLLAGASVSQGWRTGGLSASCIWKKVERMAWWLCRSISGLCLQVTCLDTAEPLGMQVC